MTSKTMNEQITKKKITGNYMHKIKNMPEDYEIINCSYCKKKNKSNCINENHYILCGNEKRKELYLLCIRCGKIMKVKLRKIGSEE